MISALDSSVILDVLTNEATNASTSEQALRSAIAQGQLVVCDCVVAEIFPVFENRDQFDGFFSDWQLEFVPSTRESAILAGSHFACHLARGGRRGRVVADFLIGAHAQHHADRLLARDRGYLRNYFKDLVVVDPTS